MRGRFFILLLATLMLAYSCGTEAVKKEVGENQYMIDLLDEQHSKANPLDLQYYYNTRRANAYDSLRKAKGSSASDYMLLTYWYFRETLNSGNTEKAILGIESFKKELAAKNKTLSAQDQSFFDRLLAVSYIRLGEQENCIINHSSASCILPISADGIHQKTQGSEKAIAVLETMLEKSPDDLELRWLLNISYQTLGRYPDDVPSKFLIPIESFSAQNDIEIPRFTDMASNLGVATRGLAGGSITEDFNNDGLLDVLVTSSGFTESDQMRYYVNNGKGGFDDKTSKAGLDGLVGGLNCVQTDYNNDGFVDIFVMRGGWFGEWGKHPNSLLRNNGDDTFTDVTKEAGILSFNPTQTSVWADFNNDGWVDVFIGNETNVDRRNLGRDSKFKIHEAEFYLNKKDGTFANVASSIGLKFTNLIKGATAIDANNDNQMDLYISIMGGQNKLLINQGNLKFKDETITYNAPEPFVSFPVGSFDYNNDGFEDLFICGYSTSNNTLSFETAYELLGNQPTAALPKLYKNNGDGSFTDVTAEAKMNHSIYGMGFNYGDLDNDGYLDIYFGTGDPSFESIIPNRMFKNIEGKYFEEVTFQGGFSNIQKGHGISWGDMDNDGDQDIYITMGGAHEGDIYQNQLLVNPMSDNNWINIQLVGNTSNKKAIGTKVHIVTSNKQHIYRTVSSGASFGGNSYDLEIGLGSAEMIELLEVTWPATGEKQNFSEVEINAHIKINEGASSIEKRTVPKASFSMDASMVSQHEHE
ncbi:FG-GAP-like repeat-containing protein [Roseivirga sp.]|uniref:FG-GAP-like repeat-containing protein n=1 Tax=Roseivirga sp. TaxID=1964215 RepID=UPI003B8DB9EB